MVLLEFLQVENMSDRLSRRQKYFVIALNHFL